MSDTVIIEEEKDIEHIAERKVAVIRKKMMAAFCVMAGTYNCCYDWIL